MDEYDQADGADMNYKVEWAEDHRVGSVLCHRCNKQLATIWPGKVSVVRLNGVHNNKVAEIVYDPTGTCARYARGNCMGNLGLGQQCELPYRIDLRRLVGPGTDACLEIRFPGRLKDTPARRIKIAD